MTIKNVIKKLMFYYNEALTLESVIKPLSWALYHTWKDVDAREKPKKREEQA